MGGLRGRLKQGCAPTKGNSRHGVRGVSGAAAVSPPGGLWLLQSPQLDCTAQMLSACTRHWGGQREGPGEHTAQPGELVSGSTLPVGGSAARAPRGQGSIALSKRGALSSTPRPRPAGRLSQMSAPNHLESFHAPGSHRSREGCSHGARDTRVAVGVDGAASPQPPAPSPQRELASATRGLGLSFLSMTWARRPRAVLIGWQESAPGAQHTAGAQETAAPALTHGGRVRAEFGT